MIGLKRVAATPRLTHADGRVAGWSLIATWALGQWLLRPAEPVTDWMGWRQADTLAIARNFVERPSGLLWPRVDWGGDGPGFVEAELQLVPWIVSWLDRAIGHRESVAQLVSLACMAGTGALLHAFLARRFGPAPALWGLLVWLCSRGVIFASTAVQPDSASLLMSAAAIVAFDRYVETGRHPALVAAAAATAAAAAIKPTALQLGVVEFVLLWIAARGHLKRAAPWLAWTAVLGIVGALLLHGNALYETYGNTFGILSGGDRKLPKLEHLLHPGLYLRATSVSLEWGVGWIGGAAGLFLLARRRMLPLEWSLLAGSVALVLVSLRYAVNERYGSHYHLPTSLLGAFFAAHAVAELRPRLRGFAWALGGFALCLGLGGRAVVARSQEIRRADFDGAFHAGKALRGLLHTGDLVIVRSMAPEREAWWDVPNNFEDPRTLYVAHARGWVLPGDRDAEGELDALLDRGARFYVEWGPRVPRPETDRVLLRRMRLVWDRGELGRIWQRCEPRAAPKPAISGMNSGRAFHETAGGVSDREGFVPCP